MTRPIRLIACGLLVLALASLACALPDFSGSNAPAAEQGSNSIGAETAIAATVAAGNPKATIEPTATTAPTPTQSPALPVGMRQGLASLNSYRMRTTIVTSGPGPQDLNRQTTVIAYNADGDRTHTHIEIVASSADDPNSEAEINDMYLIGDQQCSLPPEDEGKSPLTTIDPIQQEMSDALSDLVDFVISVKDPELVGDETVNGVATRHYRFNVAALGQTSGAEVTQSAGEYWTAIDGNYLVKYSLILETRSAPQDSSEAEVMRAEFSLDLSDINQPVSIEMPAECK